MTCKMGQFLGQIYENDVENILFLSNKLKKG